MQYEMRKLKGTDERKRTLDTRIYPVVRFATKNAHMSTLLKHSLRVSLLENQVSSVNTITITLILGSTKELLHKGWGSPRPLHKECRRRSTPSRRVIDVPASHQDSKVAGSPRSSLLAHSRTSHKVQHLATTLTHELS